MSELEEGYYWVKNEEDEKLIMEFDGVHWWRYGYGVLNENLPDGYDLLGKVSDWCSNEKEKALHKHIVSNNEERVTVNCRNCKHIDDHNKHQPCDICFDYSQFKAID